MLPFMSISGSERLFSMYLLIFALNLKACGDFKANLNRNQSIRIESAAALCSSSLWMGGMKEKTSNCF